MKPQRILQTLCFAATLISISSVAGGQTSVTLGAADDVTLYEESTGALANGAGRAIFVGRNGTGLIRRAMLKFNLAPSIPPNAVIQSATLRLRLTRNNNGAHPVTLHRALASWGEGTSDAGGQEGGGVLATTNDATWIHRFYSSSLWSRPGGDYLPQASATTIVESLLTSYDWAGPSVTADVQAWLDNSSTNFGWLVRGDESDSATAQRFDSHEMTTPSTRPQLIVVFTTPPPCAVDFDGDGSLSPDDLSDFINAYFTVPPNLSADFDQNGSVDPDDLADFISAFFAGCP